MQFHSIRFKSSILYSSILALILLIFGSFIYYNIHNILYHDLDEELKVKAKEIAAILRTYEQMKQDENLPVSQILEVLKSKGRVEGERTIIDDLWQAQFDVLNLKEDYITVLNSQGHSLLNSDNFTEEVRSLFKEQLPFSPDEVIVKSMVNEKVRLRAINLPVPYRHLQLIIQVGTPLLTIEKELKKILFFIVLTAIVLLISTGFIGNLFTRRILKPVATIANLADNITHEDLTVRLQEQEKDAEIRYLVGSFNKMLSRLDKSFKQINEFSIHVAHELKTPLAIAKGEIELALEQQRDPKEYKRVLSTCLEELNRVIIIIRDLLLLAKLDYKPDIFNFKKLNLIQFINEIYEQAKAMASTKNIDVKLNAIAQKDIYINADPVHLRRLFLNLINNAVKFTPSKEGIVISVSRKKLNVNVDITDTGEGISEENLLKIFDKFFRVHKEERMPESGVGLGLNIALSIAKAHKGDIKVKSQLHKGTTFTVILPLA